MDLKVISLVSMIGSGKKEIESQAHQQKVKSLYELIDDEINTISTKQKRGFFYKHFKFLFK